MTPEEAEMFRKEQAATLERVLVEEPLFEAYAAFWSEMQQRLAVTSGMLRLVLEEVRHNFTEEQKQAFLDTALENCNLAGKLLSVAGKQFAPRLRNEQ